MRPLELALPALEIGLNRYLASDPTALAQVAAMSPRKLTIELRDLGWSFSVRPVAHGLQLGAADPEPTATLSGSLVAFGRVLAGEDPRTLGTALGITGDAEFAEQLLRTLRQTRFDLAGELQGLIGAVTAQRVEQGLQGLVRFSRRALGTLIEDSAEYLCEESRDLVSLGEAEEWFDAVDDLVVATDRLEARLARLQADEGG